MMENIEMIENQNDKKEISFLRSQFSMMWKLCIVYGICYLLFSYNTNDGIGCGVFSFISAGCFLGVAHMLEKKYGSDLIHVNRTSIIYYMAAAIISFAKCMTDNFFFLFFNTIASFLLFSIASIKLVYEDRKWDFSKYFVSLFGYWFEVIGAISVPFQDFFACRNKKEKKRMSPTMRYVLIGIVLGLPILLVTTMLLASADQIFSDLFGKIFDFSWLTNSEWFVDLGKHIVKMPMAFVVYTFLIYLVFAALTRKNLKEDVKMPKRFGVPIAVTVFSMIDVVYVLFCGIQVMYLFAGVPAKYEYAEYARQGFFELLFVALINFGLVLFCNKHFARNKALTVVMTLTCVCTYVMMVSSAYRMILYVEAYHLTFLRVFVLWFLAMLAFLMTGSMISIFVEAWNSFGYSLAVVTCFYTLFALSGVDGKIAAYNVTQFEKDFVKMQQENAQPYIDEYLPAEYVDSKAYAKSLSAIYAQYGQQLGKENKEIIEQYLEVSFLFYKYDYERDCNVLKRDDYIYDPEYDSSIFQWKYFNFVENESYQLCKKIEYMAEQGSICEADMK